MKIAVQVPIKGRSSQRVPNKNFRNLQGKPLCHWLLDELVGLPENYDIFIDSEDETVFTKLEQAGYSRFRFHQREEWFASDEANGNHMIHQFAVTNPNYDIYAQVYVTAVTLKQTIIREAIEKLAREMPNHDSIFLVTEETGWIWFEGRAINYNPTQPNGLKRSQDASFLQETTGLYAIEKKAVLRTGCRIGENALPHLIDKQYSMDIDTMEDFREAEEILSRNQ
ncbi:MAG: hypothetical protein HOD72_06205 [Opitutae bacterium]|nr:hypothetical protein [Opitutae bacterium]MBT5378440.1 hypothetical protein [Opitutae bacterium]MBT6958556.1 hypothetical protein [Opitutae bacterium]MBT7853911.1 hypothetical protein [Opitutae bacterium]